jgi:hypothetical protein
VKRKIDFDYLLQKHIANTLSEAEKAQLLKALNDPENVAQLSTIVAGIYNRAAMEDFVYDKGKMEEKIRSIVAHTSPAAGTPLTEQVENIVPVMETTVVVPFEDDNPATGKKGKIRLLNASWIRYAAAAVLFIGAVFLYYNNKKEVSASLVTPPALVQADDPNDVLPGSNKAMLTLSNGKTIELDENGKQVITDGELTIQNDNGLVSYPKSELVAYNTMATPMGGQYKLKLPDGTTVWLNAASSITYPTSFPGDTRVVSITGEAYFEVAKNAEKPFIVKTYKDEIMVKGTSFNVNSYPDEPAVKTSLLEGLVEINGALLTPGKAYMNGKINETDLSTDLAWKNGAFNFHHVKLSEAMRQIARWYDVEIHYEGNVGDIELGGEIGRNLTLQQVLNGLQDKDTHFRLEGKVLTVY